MSRPSEPGRARFLRYLWHAARLRCPLCGDRRLFRTSFQLTPVCHGCGLRTDRGESDAFIGGFTVNFIVAELFAAGLIGGTVFLTWPDVPWRVLMWSGAALMVVLPILFFPFSRTLWLAVDLTFRPPAEPDFAVRTGAHSTLPERGR